MLDLNLISRNKIIFSYYTHENNIHAIRNTFYRWACDPFDYCLFDKKDKSIYCDLNDLLPEYKDLKTIIKKNPKSFIRFIIRSYKNNNNYENKLYTQEKIVILEKDNDSFSFKLSLDKNEYKHFIVYLMRKYKIDKRLAYEFFKQGINKRELALNLNIILPDSELVLKKIYSTEEIIELKNDIFYGYLDEKKNAKKCII